MNGSCSWIWHGKFQEKQRRVSPAVNYSAVFPDSIRILSAKRHDGGHISWHLLSARLFSHSTVLSNWHDSFRNTEMRTAKCYVNSKDSCLWFCHLKSFSISCALGTLPGEERGVWNGIGVLYNWRLIDKS